MSQEEKAPDDQQNGSDVEDSEGRQAESEAAPLGAAQDVIAAFGGIRPAATKIGVAVSTVQGWKERNAIPASRHGQIRAAARTHGIDLDPLPEALPDETETPTSLTALEPVPESPSKAPSSSPAGMARARPRSDAAEETAPSETPATSAASQATRAHAQRPGPREDAAAATPSQPSAMPPQTGPARGPGWVVGFVLGALAISLGFGGAVLTKDHWLPLLGRQISHNSAVDEAALAELSKRLSGMGADVAVHSRALQDLKDRLDSLPQGSDSGEVGVALSGLKAELEERLAALERSGRGEADARQQSQRLGAELSGLAGRTSVLEARLSDLDRMDLVLETLQQETGPPAAARDVAIMLALVQLRDSLSRGASFTAELESLRRAIGGDRGLLALLGPLEARADAGLPTVAALADDFSQVAREVVSAAAGGEGDGLVSDVLRSLSNVVSVRPVGEVEGEGPGAVVARTEARLRDGDLAGALATLSALQGVAADAAAPWRALAEARLAAEAALSDLGRRAVDRLAESG